MNQSRSPEKSPPEIPHENFPEIVSPQLAVRRETLPRGDRWQFERKYDGYRLLIRFEKGKVSLITRNNKDWTSKYGRIVKCLHGLPIEDAIFDGEIVCFDKNNHSHFSGVQRFHKGEGIELQLVIFDVLYFNGTDLQNYPLSERRKFLEVLWGQIYPPHEISLSEVLSPDQDLIALACASKWEGIMAKDLTSPYFQGRHESWLKIKCGLREEFVVIGVTPPQGERDYFGALLIAENTSEGLVYRGRVGTGFSHQEMKDLFEMLSEKRSKKPPEVKGLPRTRVEMWVEPYYFVEVDHSERTRDGRLRHPSYKGLRLDKELAGDVIGNSDRAPALSHPDKILYPALEITKRDLLEYYRKVCPQLLAFAKKAPLTLVRCPNGAGEECFFQKHFDRDVEFPKKILIKEKSKSGIYGYLEEFKDIEALVQNGVLEIHLWNSRVPDVENPRYVVFDLDPAEEVPFSKVTQTALLIREMLLEQGMESYARTTGGKGLHVVVPVRKMNWDEAYEFSKVLAVNLAESLPEDYIATMSKAQRKGKVFIDFFRNSRGSTSISNYSTRSRSGATVATPLFWEEVHEGLDPQELTILTVPARLKKLKKDPWEGFKLK